jgi:hypothetical protein
VLVFLNPDAVVEPGAGRAPAATRSPPIRAPGSPAAASATRTAGWQPAAARFGVLAHLLGDTTLGRLRDGAGRTSTPSTGCTARSWRSGGSCSTRSADSTARTFLYGEDLDLCHRAHGPRLADAARPGRPRHARTERQRDDALRLGAMRQSSRRAAVLRARIGAGAARRYRVVAAAKFGAKALVARLAGRATTAERAARVVRVCLGARAETLA